MSEIEPCEPGSPEWKRRVANSLVNLMFSDPAECPWWWLSFCDPDRPKGQQFLGVACVQAPDVGAAALAAHAVGCNPGGEISGMELPSAPRSEFQNRLIEGDEATQVAELPMEAFLA